MVACQEFRPTLELVRRIETGYVAVGVRGEPHVGGHGAAHGGVAAAKGVFEPEPATKRIAGGILGVIASVCQFPDVRGYRGITTEHLVEDTALEGFAHNEHDVVGLFRLVFVGGGIAVHRKLQSIAATCRKIFWQECV